MTLPITTRAKIDPEAIGIEVSWSFGNGDAEAVTLTREAVRTAILNSGFLGSYIEDLSADKALRDAMQTVKGRSKTIVIQELRRPNKDTPRAVGVYQVQPKEGETGDNVVCGARVRIENDSLVALAPEGADPIEPCMVVARDIARLGNSLMLNVVNKDISDALCLIGFGCFWINRRRNSGGVYYMSRSDQAERFIALLHTLEGMTQQKPNWQQFRPQVMEVYAKPLTLQLWSVSAKDQYDALVSDLEDDLKKMVDQKTMRDSTIQARADACVDLIAQAESHRLFLQGHVETLAETLKRIRDSFLRQLEEGKKAIQGAKEAVAANSPTPKGVEAAAPRQRAPKPPAKAVGFLPFELGDSDEDLFDV